MKGTMTPSKKKSLPNVFKAKEEPFTHGLFVEVTKLTQAHAEEVIPFEGMEIQPDEMFYERGYRAGIMRIFTLRMQESLIGYAIFIVGKHPFYGIRTATQDMIYIKPVFRIGAIGRLFIEWIERYLKIYDMAKIIYQSSTLKKDISVLLERMGYQPIQVSYVKVL